MNTERQFLEEPAYCVNTRKWFVRVVGEDNYFLHKDQTIQNGTAVEFVPGELTWSGKYDSRKAAKKAIKSYDTKWEVTEWALDVDEELKKELQALNIA